MNVEKNLYAIMAVAFMEISSEAHTYSWLAIYYRCFIIRCDYENCFLLQLRHVSIYYVFWSQVLICYRDVYSSQDVVLALTHHLIKNVKFPTPLCNLELRSQVMPKLIIKVSCSQDPIFLDVLWIKTYQLPWIYKVVLSVK